MDQRMTSSLQKLLSLCSLGLDTARMSLFRRLDPRKRANIQFDMAFKDIRAAVR